MEIQCLRCYKTIPVRREMIGQVVLCPACLERVYVTETQVSGAKPSTSASNPSSPLLQPLNVATTVSTRMTNDSTAQSLPIGLIAGIGGVILALVVVGIILWQATSSQNGPQTTAQSGSLPPPPPIAVAPAVEPTMPPTPSATVAPEPQTETGGSPALPIAPAAKPTAPAATPSRPANARWAEVWPLSPIDSVEPNVLASIGGSEAPWRIAVSSMAASLPFGSAIVAEPDADQGGWTLKQGGFQPTSVKEPVAMLRRDGPELMVAWSKPLNPQAGLNLRNCLLEISEGNQKRIGQLREPLRVDPISVDLTSEKQVIETQVSDPPRLEGLCVEIVEVSGFSHAATFRGGSKSAMARGTFPNAAQSVVLEFAEIPGLEVRVRIANAEPTGKLTLSIDPVFRESPTSEIDLRSPRLLSRMEDEAQKAHTEARRKLQQAETALARSQAKEKELKADEPLATDRRRRPQWQKRYQEEVNDIRGAENVISAATKIINTFQPRMDAAPKLRAFLKGSHKQATIQFVVCSECGVTDLLLVDGRGQEEGR